MLLTHEANTARETERGYVVVETRPNGLVEMAHPDHTCLHPMRYGPCRMDKGHRGRHATTVFSCDSCGKTRRGSVDQAPGRCYDSDHVLDVVFCFMCCKVDNLVY